MNIWAKMMTALRGGSRDSVTEDGVTVVLDTGADNGETPVEITDTNLTRAYGQGLFASGTSVTASAAAATTQ